MNRWADQDDDWEDWAEPDDEGPSDEDVQRFDGASESEDVAYCPNCKTEVWFESDRCPQCGEWVAVEDGWRSTSMGRWPYLLVVIVVILAAVGMAMLF